MAHVDNVRRHFAAVRTSTYLNTGTFGALPDTAVERMQQVLDLQFREGRLQGYFGQLATVREQVREQLANLFRVPESTLALTDSTTHGINVVLNGLLWHEGDEIVFTNTEHQGGMMPLFIQKQRQGIVLKQFEVGRTVEETLQRMKAAVSSRTRLVVVSHVSYETGQRLPIERIARTAHEYSALCLVDGAQGAGAEWIDLASTDIDFYALPGQKWLCGPDGVGALYVRERAMPNLEMTFGGAASLMENHPRTMNGYFLPADSARRYEYTFVNLTNWVGWLESLRFIRVQVGWDYAFSRIHGLSGTLLDQLLDVPGVEVFTPRDSRAGIVSFRMKDISAARVVAAAAERGIAVRSIPQHDLVRVSPGFYNAEDDIDRLLSLIRRPESL
ncbi:aminotransferase class V-fold PLP-dependent enzyme [Alicyclobacillus ferrooxydans]|uniref:Aminotransferase class V domain-containing protein n=1 Tax=Alicyclobacillus ferrooxydans TaxID=471514 RepID=A0A0N8PPG4_9BACL|nr:aminotransferase class V-fold PLP-dependent enzyme [Alicyclobacillus ferrooxydans]KPV44253.1 hypothetical protein AN477_08120 [Alicyclobacillus ferrooxydans]